ncbi:MULTISPECIES: sensor histidine kinase [Kordia]|uniref:sensor histidine kinase n=1 Tax=Kordia TaxID=221065 RepID=UPI0006291C2C|nr:HAMP domain-containing sensor histidine kinase [Kordia jejudonensis]
METHQDKIKLLKKIAKSYIQFGLVLALLCLISLYFITNAIIKDETDEGLYSSTHRIEELLKQNKTVTSLSPLFEVSEVSEIKPQSIGYVVLYDASQNEDEEFRELNTFIKVNNVNYKITVRTLVVESEDILISILIAFAIIFFVMYLAQYFYTNYINKIIWKPFFENLEAIKAFSVKSKSKIELKDSDILEFVELNDNLKSLTEKVISDYENLKQFTENVSHEVQTPLAIIQAKIENLIDNSSVLSERDTITLNDIQRNVRRLSKLNKSLILLTKIDNQQFSETESINLNERVSSIIEAVEEIAKSKKILISYKERDIVTLLMNKTLLDVLISNLIGNAIKYTAENGKIVISITENNLSISNSGTEILHAPEKIFQRFYKENNNTQSLGLGLAIVKKICDYHKMSIQYHFKDSMHQYTFSYNSL